MQIFSEKKREIREALQRSRPVGYALQTEMNTDQMIHGLHKNLRGIHDRDHYIVGENHGFGPHNF